MIREKVSILIPVYNLGKDVKRTVDGGVRIFSRFLSDFEMVICDDGSTDDTRRHCISAAKKYGRRVRVVGYDANRGKGSALKHAFLFAAGDYIAFCDGDLELDPSQLKGFFERMKSSSADVVIGAKWHPGSRVHYSWQRHIVSKLYYLFVKIVFQLPVRDTQTGLKLFKREVLARVFPRILVKKFAYDLEVLAVAHREGYRIVDAPIVLHAVRNARFPALKMLWSTFNDTLAIFYRLVIIRYYDGLNGETDRRPLVSIIVPIKQANDYIRQTAEHIISGAYGRFELIILPDVKNGFSSGVFRDPRIRIAATGPVPPALKRDIGARKAKGEILAFIDDDTYPEADWLINAVRTFAATKARVIGGPAPTAPDDSFLQMISGAVYSSVLMSGNYRYRYTPGRVRWVTDYPSCNLLVKRDLYFKVGGFDSTYWPGEDTIFCQKVIDAGERILYTPEVLVLHHRRKMFAAHCRQLSSYGWHRGFFVRNLGGNSLSLSYFIPSLFVMYLGSFPLLFLLPQAALLWSIPLAFYLLAVGLSSILTLSLRTAALKFAGIIVSHVVYGVSFIRGILTPDRRNS